MRTSALALLALAALTLTACSSDDDESLSNNPPQVTAAQTMLPARGGTGYVCVDRTIATAYATAPWLNVVASADSVGLSADQNRSRQSRSARLIIKTSATDSTVVSVTQQGAISFAPRDVVAVGDEAQRVTGVVDANRPGTYASLASWITVSDTGNGCDIQVKENATGVPRIGFVTFYNGDEKDSVRIVQCDFDRDVKGSYTLEYTVFSPDQDGDEEEETEMLDAVVGDETLDITVGKLGTVKIPFTWDVANAAIRIYSGAFAGSIHPAGKTYYVYASLLSERGTYVSRFINGTYSIPASFQTTADGKVYAAFGNGDIDGISLDLFQSSTAINAANASAFYDSDHFAAAWIQMLDATLWRK